MVIISEGIIFMCRIIHYYQVKDLQIGRATGCANLKMISKKGM